MHTQESIKLLEQEMRLLEQQLWKFKDYTCSLFKTTELPSEAAAHCRHAEARLKMQTNDESKTTRKGTSGVAQPKTFNLATYKIHVLGHYMNTIRTFGTTDSYTTQIDMHHIINLAQFLHNHSRDPAIQDFIPKLKDHLLVHLHNLEHDGDKCAFLPYDYLLLHYGQSLAHTNNDADDWIAYYVNIFADQDMYAWQYADPAEDDVEDQSLYNNIKASSSDPPEIAEEGEPNTADSDIGCKEDNKSNEDTGENLDSSVDEDEGGKGEAGLCDIYHISF
ncbi:hypothetical protein HD554DRAFT_2177920 [Boletus coccyginus]|nr:hypothetical protein HD554DRAFT_2177920 [Boletus coccyginus]